MKKTLVIILAVAMMLSLAAFGEGNTASADALKDTFVFAMGGEPQILDPAIAGDAVTQTAIQAMYFVLYKLDEHGAAVPNAVESCKIGRAHV